MNPEKLQEDNEGIVDAQGLEAAEKEMAQIATTIENPVKRRLATAFLAMIGAITAGGCGNLRQELERLPGNLEGALVQMNLDAQQDGKNRANNSIEQPTQAQVKLELNNTKLRYSEQWSNKPAPSKKHKK